MTEYYTDEQVQTIKKNLGLENMPTWIVWGYMQEQGISSEEVLRATRQQEEQ